MSHAQCIKLTWAHLIPPFSGLLLATQPPAACCYPVTVLRSVANFRKTGFALGISFLWGKLLNNASFLEISLYYLFQNFWSILSFPFWEFIDGCDSRQNCQEGMLKVDVGLCMHLHWMYIQEHVVLICCTFGLYLERCYGGIFLPPYPPRECVLFTQISSWDGGGVVGLEYLGEKQHCH